MPRLTWDQAQGEIDKKLAAATAKRAALVAAEQQRQQKLAQNQRVAELAIQQMYDQFAATPAEQQRILTLITQNLLDKRWDVAQHFQMLDTIRTSEAFVANHGGAQ